MESSFEVEDCLELLKELAPEDQELWLSDDEKRLAAEKILPSSLQSLLISVKDAFGVENDMNKIASKERNRGVVKLLEDESVYKGQEDADEKTKKLRQAIYRAQMNARRRG